VSRPLDARTALADAARPGVVADWLTLTKPRIVGFVALAALIGGALGARASGLAGADVLPRVAEASLWIACAAAAASTLNQVLERDVDRRMRRTADRPLPAGRLATRDAILFGAALASAATLGLALRFGLLAALLSLATILAYVAVYTPLKRVSTLNTVVGALPGAAAPLIGYAALANDVGPWAWALFATLFVWQFPHFWAIAWLYREDYRAAGMRMLPAEPGCERLAARQALVYALAILPVSLVPAVRGDAGVVFAAGALVLGLCYVLAAARFALRVDRRSARGLMVVSLVYLPLFLSLVLVDPVVRVALTQALP
jgi:protoheme IX farnesyltransferase